MIRNRVPPDNHKGHLMLVEHVDQVKRSKLSTDDLNTSRVKIVAQEMVVTVSRCRQHFES